MILGSVVILEFGSVDTFAFGCCVCCVCLFGWLVMSYDDSIELID